MSRLNGHRPYTRKRQRLVLLTASLAVLGLAAWLVFTGLGQAMLYFRVPSDVLADRPAAGERFRLGGLVADGSVSERADAATVEFRIADHNSDVPVIYSGILPDLFREGQGVIAEGSLNASGVFVADTVLAKHDETYMPKEVYDKLREQGHPGAQADAAAYEDSGADNR